MLKIERETVISFNDEESFAVVSTRHDRVKTRMKKHNIEPYRRQADYVVYRVPKTWIKISPPKKVSEEQRERLRALGKKFGGTKQNG